LGEELATERLSGALEVGVVALGGEADWVVHLLNSGGVWRPEAHTPRRHCNIGEELPGVPHIQASLVSAPRRERIAAPIDTGPALLTDGGEEQLREDSLAALREGGRASPDAYLGGHVRLALTRGGGGAILDCGSLDTGGDVKQAILAAVLLVGCTPQVGPKCRAYLEVGARYCAQPSANPDICEIFKKESVVIEVQIKEGVDKEGVCTKEVEALKMLASEVK
jgi:hypothetical protein